MENVDILKALDGAIHVLSLKLIDIKAMMAMVDYDDPRRDVLYQMEKDFAKYIEDQENNIALVENGML